MLEIKSGGQFPVEPYIKIVSFIPEGKSLIVFDGECVLCNRLIKLLIRIDRERNLLFTTFNSSLFEGHEGKPAIPHGLILINHKGMFSGSEAVLETGLTLHRFEFLIRILRFIPFSIRESAYRLTARYRYLIFGRTSQCIIPSAKDAGRFIS